MNRKFFITIAVAYFSLALFPGFLSAQSTDPDRPTFLTKYEIKGNTTGGLKDEKTYYYSFEVKPGALKITVDLVPLNKSDAGALVQWTLMTTKNVKLKYENLSAQGSADRKVQELPVTQARFIILKMTVAGNADYKFKLEGDALLPKE